MRWHEEVARFEFGFQMKTQIANNFCDEGLGTSLKSFFVALALRLIRLRQRREGASSTSNENGQR